MVVYRRWEKRRRVDKKAGFIYERTIWEGWFLFGIIPLYIRQK
jgi:hypothetical protein